MKTDHTHSTPPQSGSDIPHAGQVQLNLKSILKAIPTSKLGFDPDKIPANVVTELPMSVILPQLKSGRVELPLSAIIEGCLERYRPAFSKADLSEKVQLPVQEIYQKMPQGIDFDSEKPVSSTPGGLTNPFARASSSGASPQSPFTPASGPIQSATPPKADPVPSAKAPLADPAPKNPFSPLANPAQASPFATQTPQARAPISPFSTKTDQPMVSSPFSTANSPFSPVKEQPNSPSPFRTAKPELSESLEERPQPPKTEEPVPAKANPSPFAAISESLEARSAADDSSFPKGLFTPLQNPQSTPPSHSPFDRQKETPSTPTPPAPASIEAKPVAGSTPSIPKVSGGTPFSHTPAPQKALFQPISPSEPVPQTDSASEVQTKVDQAQPSPPPVKTPFSTPATTPPSESPFPELERTAPPRATEMSQKEAPSVQGSSSSKLVKPEVQSVRQTSDTAPQRAETSKARGFDFGFQDEPEQLVLRALFDTDSSMTAAEALDRTGSLPGIRACVLINKKTEATSVGKGKDVPATFEEQAKRAFSKVLSLAEDLEIGSAESFTLKSSQGAMSFFNAEKVCLTVLHQEPFSGGLREKLILIARELSTLQK